MAIRFDKITTPQHPFCSSMLTLYNEAFPDYERRVEADFLLLMQGDAPFCCYALSSEGEFVGLITLWHFEHFRFVEHFAIDPALRGRDFGSKVMEAVIKWSEQPIILEVEPPTNEQSERRIRFYNRLGFEVVETAYLQPPYQKGFLPTPLYLMCNKGVWPKNAVQILHRQVYRYFADEAVDG